MSSLNIINNNMFICAALINTAATKFALQQTVKGSSKNRSETANTGHKTRELKQQLLNTWSRSDKKTRTKQN